MAVGLEKSHKYQIFVGLFAFIDQGPPPLEKISLFKRAADLCGKTVSGI